MIYPAELGLGGFRSWLRRLYRNVGFGASSINQADARLIKALIDFWASHNGPVVLGLKEAAIRRCAEFRGDRLGGEVVRSVAGALKGGLEFEFGRRFLRRAGILDGFSLNLSRLVQWFPHDRVQQMAIKTPEEICGELLESLKKSLLKVDWKLGELYLHRDFGERDWVKFQAVLGFNREIVLNLTKMYQCFSSVTLMEMRDEGVEEQVFGKFSFLGDL